MMTIKTTLCIVQWRDGDDVRVSIAGWDDPAPVQKDDMLDQALQDIDPTLVELIRFVEVAVPILEPETPFNIPAE